MPSPLAEAHIASQAELRALITRALTEIWTGLPGYDRANVDQWLRAAIPVVLAGQRKASELTSAYLARGLGRLPAGIPRVDYPALRAGVPIEDVYQRPFITIWSALSAGTQWDQAVASGLNRATATAATDVQLSMRETLRTVGETDERIVGYSRVPDGGACEFCRLVAGQRYRTDQLMPIHSHCGCGVDVITEATRGDFTGKPENDLSVSHDGITAAVREHGELGPVLVNGAHHFDQL